MRVPIFVFLIESYPEPALGESGNKKKQPFQIAFIKSE
jgi:hypothetical protein